MKTILIIAAAIALICVGFMAYETYLPAVTHLTSQTTTANQILDEALAGK